MSTEKLWEEYEKKKSPEIREKLILEYTQLVRIAAARLSTHVGAYVDMDDLIGYGIFGLIDAIDKFDIKKGVQFSTYATLRIRGEMLDNIRKLDWVPRTLRQKNKIIDKAAADFELENGRKPTEDELAEAVGMPVEEVRELIQKSNVAALVSLDDYLEQGKDGSVGLAVENDENPERSFEMKENKRILAEAIKSLSEKQRLVITLYYYEELTLKEIGKIMNVSESRVSQIHKRAVELLANKIGKGGERFFFK